MKKKNYLNNTDLLIELALSHQQNKMTNNLASMFMTMVDKFGSKPNYSSYSYIDDMQSYALVQLCANWMKFDCNKSQNPFAYFTFTIENAFKYILNKEKAHRVIIDEIKLVNGVPVSSAYEEDEYTIPDELV